MIRSLTIVRPTASAAEQKALSRLFDALGFERGAGWDSGREKGESFLAPAGNLEIAQGWGAGQADLLVEVSDLDAAHATAKKSRAGAVGGIAHTTWKSRMFLFDADALRIGFWQFDKPPRARFQTREGELMVAGARFGIVVSRFNAFITERLLQGALDALHRSGTRDQDIEVVRVPGAFEVPLAARTLALQKKPAVDAVICLGLLMRGETSNYEHMANEVARGIGRAAEASGKPCTYGVLTCDTLEQAVDRAGLKMGNKGFEAAISAVEMVSLGRKLRERKKQGKQKNQGKRSAARKKR